MPDPLESTPASGVEQPAKPTQRRTRRVLLIDPNPSIGPALERIAPKQGKIVVVQAATLQAARDLLNDAGKIDLAIVPQTIDAAGLALAQDLRAKDAATAAIVLADKPDFAFAQQAMQAGASDLILKPTDTPDAGWLEDAGARVAAVLDRQWVQRVRSTRIRKLKRLCRRLDDARAEVSDQVDILCNDLVTAYQELAVQMQNVTQAEGYKQTIGEELDLEVVLRKTLEYIVQQAGPCNAAVFLPASADEFSLGGYVNYDCTKESADMLLEHLADVLAPVVAARDEAVMRVTDNRELDELLGDDWNYLADCDLLALPVNSDGEALAVITLFRDRDQPFTEPAIDAMSSVADQMGELLGRIIRVHHRAMPGYDDAPSDETYLPPTEWDGYQSEADPFDEEDELPF
ncbi:MAG: response regulator [Phycisphaeraceae bacterium]